MMKFYILSYLLLVTGNIGNSNFAHDDAWIEPNAWGGQGSIGTSDVCDKCVGLNPVAIASEDAVALVYYKKFIATLFNRKNLQYDESDSLFKRSLHFRILPSQLERLEQITDPRDLDSVLTEIYTNAKAPYAYNANCEHSTGLGIGALFMDIFRDVAQLLNKSEIQFVLVVLFSISLGWFVQRRFNIGLFVTVFGGIIIFGYFVTYLECNRKLEVEQMLEVLELDESTNYASEPTWFGRLRNYFGANDATKEATKEKIRKSNQIRLRYCRPDHVLMLYMNDLFLTQLEFLLEKCTATVMSLKVGLSFPFNYLAPPALLLMVVYIIKLTFKYILSPKAWASLLHRPVHAGHTHPQQPTYSEVGASNVDRISGENLKLLLNAISTSTTKNQNTNSTPTISGVEEVVEQLEAPCADKSPKNSSANSSSEVESPTKAQNNNNEQKNKELSTGDVSLEDIID